MGILLWSFLILLALVILIIGAVVLTPMTLGLIIKTEPKLRVKVGIAPFFGLARITLHDSAEPSKEEPKKPDEPKPDKPWRPSKRTVGYGRRAIAAFPDLLSSIWHRVFLDHLKIDADIGLGDPADTGQLYGLLIAPAMLTSNSERIDIAIRPDFMKERLSGEIDAALRFTPAAFFWPILVFLTRVVAWRA
ncbi:MAG: DUF2953 domain-containing protein [Pseudomonadota bacterium]